MPSDRTPDDAVTLSLRPELRSALLELLTGASGIPDGADMLDHLPDDPWGDLGEFRARIFDPLVSRSETAPQPTGEEAHSIRLNGEEARLLGDVLVGLSQGFSNGTPWTRLTRDEQAVVDRVVSELGDARERPR